MKKISKKQKIGLMIFLGVLILAAFVIYFGKGKLFWQAETPFLPENQIENKIYSRYQDESGNLQEDSDSVLAWKVDLVTLTTSLQGREQRSKKDISGTMVVNLGDNTLGTVEIKLNEEGQFVPDWTNIATIENPNLDYNLIVKIPGYLPKHLDNIKLNQQANIATNTMYAGDVNLDGVIDINDFSGLMADWMTNNFSTDFNGDKLANIIDFSMMMSNWGKTGNS